MTQTEISRRLALAIGYEPQDVIVSGEDVLVRRDFDFEGERVTYGWRLFDHTDRAVIYPIAEHFKMFPQWLATRKTWMVKREWLFTSKMTEYLKVTHDCPATCIALAVIEASERGLLL